MVPKGTLLDSMLQTALHPAHVKLGAKMVPFAGYDMPVQYEGIMVEAQAVRESAGMFDVSHMARLRMKGENVLEYLEWVTANDVSKLRDMEGQYSLLPNPAGGCVDDIIVYRINATEFVMVVNAANHEKDVAWLSSQNSFGVEIADETTETTMIAVQGPKARAIVKSLASEPEKFDVVDLFTVVETSIAGVRCFAPCSGYTGEDGFELVCSNADALNLWNALFEAGIKPCGLGSRDTLRVEAGLPLYGHELGDNLSPIEAGLGWVISKTKEFIGSAPINDARTNGTKRKLQGIRLEAKRLLVSGTKVFVDGKEVGEVCSGVISTTLGVGIAFAFVDAALKPPMECQVEIRGKMEPARLVNKRFHKRA
jgi:aminomethyltransferase